MQRSEILNQIIQTGLVPVVRTPTAESALLAVEAIFRGGLRIAEITMTVPGAMAVLEKLADRFGDQVLLGAGTVLDPETARISILAGAQFIVSPSLKTSTLELAKRYSKVVVPGTLTPTEVLTAWEAGADAVKVFPCAAVGGPAYIRSLKGPFPQIELIPSGGVNLETTAPYLQAGACAVTPGAEFIDAKTLAEGNYQVIEARTRQYLDVVAKARAK